MKLSLNSWQPLCPKCGSILLGTNYILTSMPAQYEYYCKDCRQKYLKSERPGSVLVPKFTGEID